MFLMRDMVFLSFEGLAGLPRWTQARLCATASEHTTDLTRPAMTWPCSHCVLPAMTWPSSYCVLPAMTWLSCCELHSRLFPLFSPAFLFSQDSCQPIIPSDLFKEDGREQAQKLLSSRCVSHVSCFPEMGGSNGVGSFQSFLSSFRRKKMSLAELRLSGGALA